MDPDGLDECSWTDVADFFLFRENKGMEFKSFLTKVASSLEGTSKFIKAAFCVDG